MWVHDMHAHVCRHACCATASWSVRRPSGRKMRVVGQTCVQVLGLEIGLKQNLHVSPTMAHHAHEGSLRRSVPSGRQMRIMRMQAAFDSHRSVCVGCVSNNSIQPP